MFLKTAQNLYVVGDRLKKCADCGRPIEQHRPRATRCNTCVEKRNRTLWKENTNKRTFSDNHWIKKETHEIQGDECVMCGWGLPNIAYGGCVVHHIVPIADGGLNHSSNTVVLCPNCHVMAHHGLYTEEEIRQRVLMIEQIAIGRVENLRSIVDFIRQ